MSKFEILRTVSIQCTNVLIYRIYTSYDRPRFCVFRIDTTLHALRHYRVLMYHSVQQLRKVHVNIRSLSNGGAGR